MGRAVHSCRDRWAWAAAILCCVPCAAASLAPHGRKELLCTLGLGQGGVLGGWLFFPWTG